MVASCAGLGGEGSEARSGDDRWWKRASGPMQGAWTWGSPREQGEEGAPHPRGAQRTKWLLC